MKILNKFKGFSAHRYNREPLEKLFAECWQEENTQLAVRNCTLDHLLQKMVTNGDIYYAERQTKEIHKIPATLIQWLGSSVGQGFLRTVIEKAMKQKIPMEMIATLRGYMIPLYDSKGFFKGHGR